MRAIARSITDPWPNHPAAGRVAVRAGILARHDVLDAGEPIPAPNKILVPVDFSEGSLETLRYAVPLARQFGASLSLLHVIEKTSLASDWGNPSRRGWLREELAGIGVRVLTDLRHRELGPDVPGETLVRVGEPAHTIARAAQEFGIDLIIMSVPIRSRLKHALFSPLAERVARATACPMLTIGGKPRSATMNAAMGRHPIPPTSSCQRLAGFKRRVAELFYRLATNCYVFYGSLILAASLVVGAITREHEELWRTAAALGIATVVMGLLHAWLDSRSARETLLPHAKKRAKKP